MTTRAEAKYRIVAEDKGSDAFKSFKRNVTAANETVEKFRSVMRLGMLAVGAGGFASALVEGIHKGSEFNATLAGAQVSLNSLKASAESFQLEMSRNVAPAIALVSDAMTKLVETATDAQAGEKGAGFWDSFLAGLAGGGNAALATQAAAALRGKRLEIEALGQAAMETREMQKLYERGIQLTDSVRTAQEKYNDAQGEFNWLLQQGALTQTAYQRLLKKTRDELFPKQEPLIEVPFKPVIEPAEEFAPYTDEWHQVLLDSMLPGSEDIPLAKTKWGLFWGEIDAAATEAAGGMAQAFTDALFDIENAFDHLQRYAESVFRAISDALINRYIAGPILSALGLGAPQQGGLSGGGYSAPIGPTPGGDPMGKALAGAGAGVTVQVNVNAIDTQTGMEFVARNARSIGAVVRREIERGRFRG